MNDIRWKQRHANYLKALKTLKAAVALARERPLSELEQQGLIQSYEYTHELAWKLLKDYLEAQGFSGLVGSKNATREAFKNGLITEGEIWMEMIDDRNLTSHTYDKDTADSIVANILNKYAAAFLALETTFAALLAREDADA